MIWGYGTQTDTKVHLLKQHMTDLYQCPPWQEEDNHVWTRKVDEEVGFARATPSLKLSSIIIVMLHHFFPDPIWLHEACRIATSHSDARPVLDYTVLGAVHSSAARSVKKPCKKNERTLKEWVKLLVQQRRKCLAIARPLFSGENIWEILT